MIFNMSLTDAILNNCPGTIRIIMAKHLNATTPTISEKQIEAAKMLCVYTHREHLLKFFEVPSIMIFKNTAPV